MCSDRVAKRQIGIRQDRIAIAKFFGRKLQDLGANPRGADEALVGLANHRLQPLGHLTAARKI